MKNMKVSQKLILSFLMVVALALIIGIVGIVGMSQISGSMSQMYEMQTYPMPYMTTIVENIQRQRACMREMIIGAALVQDLNDPRDEGVLLVEDAYARVYNYRDLQIAAQDIYKSTILDPAALDTFDEAVRIYETRFLECIERIYEYAKQGQDAMYLYDLMGEYTADINLVVENFDHILSMKVDTAQAADTAGDEMASMLTIVLVAVLVVSTVIAVMLAIYISNMLSRPLQMISSFMKRAGTTGDIEITPAEQQAISTYGKYKDEVGQTIAASNAFIAHVTKMAEELEVIAGGDLTHDIQSLSDKDVMGKSMQTMLASLNDMFVNINASTAQVSTGAKQVADGAQSLAQGSTEQAASIEQLSASIGDIATSTKSNAETAAKTAKLSGTIKENAEKGSRQMDDMIAAVQDINEASVSISKIIKTIDDIAFQTNILALNAAVEAARAGQHGKGFAVVAEEVRNLASKSADAAKDTGDMIQNSMSKAELGSQIAGETAASLKEIVNGISESSELIDQIAQASEDQSLAIGQINTGVDQVAQVVQQNSATAEQSAAASEEMSGQSTMLEELISQFKIKNQGGGFKSLPGGGAKKQAALEAPSSGEDHSFGDDSFGKY